MRRVKATKPYELFRLFRFFCIRQWRGTANISLWSNCSGLCFTVTMLEAADGEEDGAQTAGREITLEMTINSSAINTSPTTLSYSSVLISNNGITILPDPAMEGWVTLTLPLPHIQQVQFSLILSLHHLWSLALLGILLGPCVRPAPGSGTLAGVPSPGLIP